jgi:virginiamycin A acetyltransferase
MKTPVNKIFNTVRKRITLFFLPKYLILFKKINWNYLEDYESPHIKNNAKLNSPYNVYESSFGKYSYIDEHSKISHTSIGKFCSIGPNFFCGWGIHPTNGISTSPMFYSTKKQNGITLSILDKIEERKPIVIGNDVFIGANVTVLDGTTIGDGAIVGAGSVVSKNLPPYAIAVGCPIKVIRYRFDEKQIEALLRIKWWNFTEDKLQDIEKFFFDIETFLKANDTIYSNSKL